MLLHTGFGIVLLQWTTTAFYPDSISSWFNHPVMSVGVKKILQLVCDNLIPYAFDN